MDVSISLYALYVPLPARHCLPFMKPSKAVVRGNDQRTLESSCRFEMDRHRLMQTWWAHQDSNLEPDRYERSALTIEL